MVRPEVIAIFSQSLTGQLALESGESNAARLQNGLTTEEDQAHFRAWIDKLDAVVCSRSTMAEERGAVRNRGRSQIPWFVACRESNFKDLEKIPLWRQDGVPAMGLHFTGSFEPHVSSVRQGPPCALPVREFLEKYHCADLNARALARVSWSEFLAELSDFGLKRIGVLGGPAFLTILLAAGQIDRMEVSLTPSLALGSSELRLHVPRAAQSGFRLDFVSHQKDTVFLSYLKT